MIDSDVAQVRRFNRLVTQRVGALDDRFLARDRPLGAARLLWEIGADGCDVRLLRARLGLDSGYLSRLLRSLETARLVVVDRSAGDGRVRTARLTPAGIAEREELDRRSEELARSVLEPLGAPHRERLVAAMAEVERLLTAALVVIEEVDPGTRDARYCVREYFAELDRRFANGFDAPPLASALAELRPPAGLFVVARLRGEPVGSGGLRFLDDGATELKRMWVAPSARGLGLGRRLLNELEARAVAHGRRSLRLETNRSLTQAIALYESAGYREVEPFNALPYADHWFEKRL